MNSRCIATSSVYFPLSISLTLSLSLTHSLSPPIILLYAIYFQAKTYIVWASCSKLTLHGSEKVSTEWIFFTFRAGNIGIDFYLDYFQKEIVWPIFLIPNSQFLIWHSPKPLTSQRSVVCYSSGVHISDKAFVLSLPQEGMPHCWLRHLQRPSWWRVSTLILPP